MQLHNKNSKQKEITSCLLHITVEHPLPDCKLADSIKITESICRSINCKIRKKKTIIWLLNAENVERKLRVRSGRKGLYYQVERHLCSFCYSFQLSDVMRKLFRH